MKLLAGIASIASATLALAACTSSGHRTQNGKTPGPDQFVAGGTFTMAVGGDPGNLTPAAAVNAATNLLLSFTNDTLVYSDAHGKVEPRLADKWVVKPNSVTLSLHRGATCSDGSAVTPSGVAQYLNYVVNPKTKSLLLGVLIPADMTATGDDSAGIVTLQTKGPSPFLLQAAAAIFIVCGKGVTDPPILAESTSGSGPYVLTQFTPNNQYVLNARPGYTWGPNGSSTATKGVPAKVVLKVVTSEATAANLLLAGDLNAAIFTGVDRSRVQHAPGVLSSGTAGGTDSIYFNEDTTRVAHDQVVRQALAESVDLSQLGEVTSQGFGVKATSLADLPPEPCQVDSITGHQPSLNVAAAEAALDKAGWTTGSDGVRVKDGKRLALKVIFPSDQDAGQSAGAEYLASQWKKIGVAVTLQGEATTAYSNALFTTGDWDVTAVGIGLSLPSQFVGYVSGPAVPKGSNFGHIANPAYDRLAKKAMATSLASGGCNVWAQAAQALFADYDVVPVVGLTGLVASKGAEVTIIGGFAQPTLFRMLKS
ncbi:MAG: ABC transporter substrate-binding protein [Actinomycetota bacterium]|nr:ABC transporter substrate-binding protein [Actinomycetota bacterium]